MTDASSSPAVELPRGDVKAMYERGRSMVESKKCKWYIDEYYLGDN